MNERPLLVANVDWALDALAKAAASVELQIHQREQPTLRLVYIARRRDAITDPPWNWCRTCNIEIHVRRVHHSAVQCPSCAQRFVEVHEGSRANAEWRATPGYAGPFHDLLSAAWHKWSLQPVGKHSFPDGALAYDVTPFRLPTLDVYANRRGACFCAGATR